MLGMSGLALDNLLDLLGVNGEIDGPSDADVDVELGPFAQAPAKQDLGPGL